MRDRAKVASGAYNKQIEAEIRRSRACVVSSWTSVLYPSGSVGTPLRSSRLELPALQAWSFDKDKASRIPQPVLFIISSESGPLFERPKQLFQSSVPQTEVVVLPGLDTFCSCAIQVSWQRRSKTSLPVIPSEERRRLVTEALPRLRRYGT